MSDNTKIPIRWAHRIAINSGDECWLWTGALDVYGYGKVQERPFRNMKAHRVVYTATVGPIPDGLVLDHLCRVRHCVNPCHLEPVTNAENQARGQNATAVNARKTNCLRGHAFTSDNITRSGRGRRCKTCHRNTMRIRREAASRGDAR